MIFRVGIGYQPFKVDENSLTLSVDALHLSDNYESLNVGAEYSYDDFIFIRGGYKSLLLTESEESFALGFGLKQLIIGNVGLNVDYAYQDFGRLNSIQKFTVGISF